MRYELIPPDPEEPGQGLAALPEPSPGDLFLDFESDPWALEGGLEFLVGTVAETDGRARLRRAVGPRRATRRSGRSRSSIDTIVARREAHPGMHVYHYGAYEAGAIKRLMGRYATREEEVDQLLRGGVLVDLFSVVRQGVRVSQESYSLKKVEKLYMPQREGPKTRPGFALVEYEKWMESRDRRILDSLAAYNRDDCVSIHRMRTWLEGLRQEAEAAFGIDARPSPAEGGRSRARRSPPSSKRPEGGSRRSRRTCRPTSAAAHGRAAGALDPRPAPRLAPARGQAGVVAPLLPAEGPGRGARRVVRRSRAS